MSVLSARPRRFQRGQRLADLRVEILHGCVIRRDDAPLLRGGQVLEHRGNPARVLGPDGRQRHVRGPVAAGEFEREIERRVRLRETEPQAEAIVAILLEELARAVDVIAGLTVRVVHALRQNVRVHPDRRGILERPPRTLDLDVGWRAAGGLRGAMTPIVRLVHAVVEAVAPGLVDEVHLAHGTRPEAFALQVLGNRVLRFRERRRQQRHAGGVRQLPGDHRLPRRRADRRVRVRAVEADAPRGQTI